MRDSYFAGSSYVHPAFLCPPNFEGDLDLIDDHDANSGSISGAVDADPALSIHDLASADLPSCSGMAFYMLVLMLWIPVLMLFMLWISSFNVSLSVLPTVS
jgi:hypothetical protein